MNQRHEIFADYDEKHLRAVMAYAQTDDDYLFYDPAYENKIEKDVVVDLFNKGLLRVTFQEGVFNPTLCKVSGSNAVITVHDDAGNYSFKSAEAAE